MGYCFKALKALTLCLDKHNLLLVKSLLAAQLLSCASPVWRQGNKEEYVQIVQCLHKQLKYKKC